MVTKPAFIERQSQTVRVTKPVSSRGYVLRIETRSFWTLNDTSIVAEDLSTSPSEKYGFRNRQTINEFVRNTLSAFRHSKTPHVFGRRLLGAYQMAEGVFLSEDESITVMVTKPVSSRGYVSRAANRSPWPPNDTGVVTVTSTDLYV
ncbi:hypothetical protein AMJ83_10555 [candidate division WOR_3 bacterium SM23_42]|uniref:Uncharacterized protein n=1 Tax=candidate division WOR_3 bacterium SM23_42 TaxID=1703779 RepID=A0A0S8FQZ1_UNCW3|nr:MAG: hypothetical protein AMJ83_10555 [candidate division WOR_3 bacterium SM23_42]